MCYRHAPAAIDWLCRVFGFERHGVYTRALEAGAEVVIAIEDKPRARISRVRPGT
jgi:uncharacterized glyoxalase superfamily protein PhnB